MSDFLARAGHPDARRATSRSTSPPISTWSSSATPSRAATPSSRRCSIARSATARCPRRSAIIPLGRAVDRHRRHARQDHDDVADRLGADARRRRSERAHRRHRRELRRAATGIGGGREFVIEGDEYDSAFFDKTAKFLKYLPDIAVINNVEFDHADIYADLDAVRLAFRRFVNLVPRRGLLLLGADSAEARGAGGDARIAGSRRSGCRTAPTGRRTISKVAAGIDAVQRAAQRRRRSAAFEVPLLGAHNVRNALAAIAVGAAVGLSTEHDRARRCARFAA